MMSDFKEIDHICYEQPLNERMRTFLRYEQLTHRFLFFLLNKNIVQILMQHC